MSSKSQNTKNRILRACWDLLENDRSNGVRMSDVAKASRVSRQAVYLHFPTRAELLIATTRYIDVVKNVEDQIGKVLDAQDGEKTLHLFVQTWGNYMLEIDGVAKALLAMQDKDEEAKLAWEDRMQVLRSVASKIVDRLSKEKKLTPSLTKKQATDLLLGLLSFRMWEHLGGDCGWSQSQYLKHMEISARKSLLR